MTLVEKIKEFWNNFAHPQGPQRDDQLNVMNEEEKLDQSIDESFPASDPPAHNNFN